MPKVLILSHADVDRLMPPEACIPVMEGVFAALARGELHQPLRTSITPEGAAGILGLMPAYRGGAAPMYGLKVVTVFPGNPARGKDSHQGGVLLFSGETGELLALMNASAITANRTAAASAVATKLLAREDAGDFAIVGAGVEARTHLPAIAAVRKLRRVRVAARRPENAHRFAEEVRARYTFPVEAVKSVEEAVRGADLICTVTSSKDPILRREWIANGAHLNVVGSSVADRREVDSATMAAARVFVDRRESTLNEGGDFLFAAKELGLTPDHIRAELGEILIGSKPGRSSRDEITLFKSLGLAVEDLAAAEFLLAEASARKVGTWVEF